MQRTVRHARIPRTGTIILCVAVLALAGTTISACSGQPRGTSNDCSSVSDCNAGWICSEAGSCKELCITQSDCDSGSYCTPSNTCEPSRGGAKPTIESVAGNSPSDPNRILDGLVLQGTNLDSATFELGDGTTTAPLEIRTQSPGSVELVFAADIRQGAYTLVATNAAGEAAAPVQLTLPDFTGDLAIQRINAVETTERISLGRLDGEVQQRIAGTCPVGQSIRSVTQTGTVSCQPDAGRGLTAGILPVADGASLLNGSIYDDRAGNIGIGVTDPAGQLEVGSGYLYAFDSNVAGTLTPACACDINPTLYDCGSADFSSTYFQEAVCYDTGTGGNDKYVTSSEPHLIVSSTGNVGIGVRAPLAPLHVKGPIISETGIGSTTYNVVSYFTATNTPAFIHIKTPFSPAIASEMFHFHVRGYAYGPTKVVDLTFVGYAYTASNTVINRNTIDPTAFFAPEVYKGSDGFAYLRFGSINTYYLSFTVDSMYVGNGRIVEPGELTVIRSTTAYL